MRAGLSLGALSACFPDKNALIEAAFFSHIETGAEIVPPASCAKFETSYLPRGESGMSRQTSEKPALQCEIAAMFARGVFSAASMLAFEKRHLAVMIESLEAMQGKGEISPPADLELTALAPNALLVGYVLGRTPD